MLVAMLSAVYPLSTFDPDIMPRRLDLLDGGFEQAQFVRMCEQIATVHRMVFYDHEQMQAAQCGAIIL
jgi:hypothetical protein